MRRFHSSLNLAWSLAFCAAVAQPPNARKETGMSMVSRFFILASLGGSCILGTLSGFLYVAPIGTHNASKLFCSYTNTTTIRVSCQGLK